MPDVPPSADRSFYEAASLNVATYDLRHPVGLEGMPVAGDAAFYRSVAERTGGPILELACGTGRIVFFLAEAGFDVIGLDRSSAMLNVARTKLAHLDSAIAGRIGFVEGDMANFQLDRQFALVVIAFRSFQALLTPDLQRACLQRAHAHLQPGGLLVLDLFDPLLDRCTPDAPPMAIQRPATLLANGHAVKITILERRNDPLTQTFHERWRFAETDADGREVRVEEEGLALRWTYRYELRHLLELTGFSLEEEYSDFDRSPPAYGGEIIAVTRAES
jgi:ubiquinone/menaquinone biosynthesis C-methylase UbiE